MKQRKVTRPLPWLRLIAESVAIIVSILLAFAIDAWWENRLERIEEKEVLEALRVEIGDNIELLNSALRFREASMEACLKLMEAASEELSSDRIDVLLGSLVWWDRTTPNVGELTALLEGGKLSLLRDKALRASVAALPSEYAKLRQREEQHFETFKHALMPYLYKHAQVAQLTNAQPGAPGTHASPVSALPVPSPKDHSDIIVDGEFMGILTNLVWDHSDAIHTVTELRAYLLDLERAIGVSLKAL